jgi:DivIVA domain-containing protein
MIDLTPLDVRNKRGDFKRLMRGYDPHEVDVFLELTAERLEVLVRENLQLRERTTSLQSQVETQAEREQAVQDALVTAQELRADIQAQSQREADHVVREAQAESRRMIAEAEAEARRLIAEAEEEVRSRLRGIERRLDHAQDAIKDLERRRVRFLKEFRSLLEREMDVVEVEEDRAPFEDRAIDLDLGRRSTATPGTAHASPPFPAAVTSEVQQPSPSESSAAASEAEVVSLEDEASPSHPAPEARDTAGVPSRAGTLSDEPSSLEIELMAGAASAADMAGRVDERRDERNSEVPDLETLLSEAGGEELRPSGQDIAPPAAPGVTSDNMILFDPDDPERKR